MFKLRTRIFILLYVVVSNSYFSQITNPVNLDFEASSVGSYTAPNSITGWSLSCMYANGCVDGPWLPFVQDFSIVSTPLTNFPGLGIIGNSPFGGTKVAQLNNFTPDTRSTRLSTTFSVTAANAVFQFAYAGYFEKAGVSCCDAPGVRFRLIDCLSDTISCQSFSISSCSIFSTYPFTGSNATGYWLNWQIRTIDLTPYIGTCVTFQAWCIDESYGAKYASMLLDARCLPSQAGVSYCSGSNIAQITAPMGYSTYTWQAPAASSSLSVAQASLASLTITNPVPASVFTLNSLSASGCSLQLTYTLNPSQVSILNLNTKPSCQLGSNGSATVNTFGSGLGYTYNWVNANNITIGTSSVITGLSAGNYTVSVSAINNTACGTVTNAITIATAQPMPQVFVVPYCSSAYLYGPTGTNYQWYNSSSSLISGSLGVQPNYTVTAPSNGMIYKFGYTNQLCRDSAIYFLQSGNPGSLFVQASSYSCATSPSGSITVSFTPAANNPYTLSNTFTIMSAQSNTPAYNYTVSTANNSFTNAAMFAGTTYSIIAFDGVCFKSSSFYLNPITPPFNFSVNLQTPTVCSGNSVNASINLNVPYNQGSYTFSWTPNNFMSAGSNVLQNVVFSPTAPIGSTSSVIYTIVVTPTIANCPVSNTFQLITGNPVTPTIAAVPSLCLNSPVFSVAAIPLGGYFINNNFNGVITPSLFSPGTYTNAYAVSVNSCVASSSFAFNIYPLPNLVVSANSTVCAGSQVMLMSTGANSYLWNNLQTGTVNIVSPFVTSVYSVVGTNTLTNCQNTKSTTLTVLPLPNLVVSGNLTICAGEIAVLTASGAFNYTWAPGIFNSTFSVSPLSDETYTVTGISLPIGCFNTSTVLVIVNECLGVSSEKLKDKLLSIYPNPSEGKFYIEHNEDIDINVFNNLGVMVYSNFYFSGVNTIDISNLDDGVYSMVYSTKSMRKKVRILKFNSH